MNTIDENVAFLLGRNGAIPYQMHEPIEVKLDENAKTEKAGDVTVDDSLIVNQVLAVLNPPSRNDEPWGEPDVEVVPASSAPGGNI